MLLPCMQVCASDCTPSAVAVDTQTRFEAKKPLLETLIDEPLYVRLRLLLLLVVGLHEALAVEHEAPCTEDMLLRL